MYTGVAKIRISIGVDHANVHRSGQNISIGIVRANVHRSGQNISIGIVRANVQRRGQNISGLKWSVQQIRGL
jgi:hypothetical protein